MPTEPKFGRAALVADEFGLAMSPEERLEHSLADPSSPAALPIASTKQITKARLQYATAELVHQNIGKVNQLIDQVATDSPKAAVELIIEIMKFSMPQMKAVAMQINDPQGKPMNSYTLAELEALEREAAEGKVVSDQ